MSTKNLARTVIEIGRADYSKYARRQRNRKIRRLSRAFCYDAETLEDLEDLDGDPSMQEAGNGNWGVVPLDNLGPAFRWMDSRVGRPWAEVYSELSTKFRGNKPIPVSHVVDTHMLDWVDVPGSIQEYRWMRGNYFRVDDDGILRRDTYPRSPWNRFPKHKRPVYSQAEVEAWAGKRKVIVRGKRLYWTRPDEIHRYNPWAEGTDVYFTAHRQGEEFSAEDYAFWSKLRDYQRDPLRNVAD